MAYYAKLDPAMQQTLSEAIRRTLPAQVQALKELVRIPSEKLPPDGAYPFGLPMQQALDYTLELARSFGFATKELDGYAGTATYGEGAETLGVLTHLDVVPAGSGWSFDPFGGVEKDGAVYGRGTTDDKGPALHTLFALAAIAQCGIPLQRAVQLIFGCDEESGGACMDRFKQTERIPDLSFSPDAVYPIVFSERAIIHATFGKQRVGSKLTIKAGTRANVVPGTAEAFVPCAVFAINAPEGFAVQLTPVAGGTNIVVTGQSAHASMPEAGRNAIQLLLKILCTLPLGTMDEMTVKTLHEAFQMDMHGETLGLDTEDETGRLTLNVGLIVWDEQGVSITIDARCPRSLPCEELTARVGAALSGFTLTEDFISPGHFMPLNSELVQTLLGVYRAQTGDSACEPLAIGGGTYARHMPNAVAFGCEFPGDPMLAHMADEYLTIERIEQNTVIIADAIVALAQ